MESRPKKTEKISQKETQPMKPTKRKKYYVACLSVACAKAQKHIKSCIAFGEPYPVNSLSKTKK